MIQTRKHAKPVTALSNIQADTLVRLNVARSLATVADQLGASLETIEPANGGHLRATFLPGDTAVDVIMACSPSGCRAQVNMLAFTGRKLCTLPRGAGVTRAILVGVGPAECRRNLPPPTVARPSAEAFLKRVG